MLNKATYDALPYAYIGAGFLNAVLLQSPVKFLPALILVIAGLLVLGWRRSARMRTRQTSTRKAQQRHAHLTPWLG